MKRRGLGYQLPLPLQEVREDAERRGLRRIRFEAARAARDRWIESIKDDPYVSIDSRITESYERSLREAAIELITEGT